MNAYRFIDRLVSQKHSRNSIVNYHTEESDSSLKTQMRVFKPGATTDGKN